MGMLPNFRSGVRIHIETVLLYLRLLADTIRSPTV